MTNRRSGRRRRLCNAGAGRAGLFLFLAGSGGGVAAANWDFDSTLDDKTDLRYVYVDRDGADGGAGSVIQFSPGFTLKRAGGRARLDIDYRMDISAGLSDINPETLTHDLTATGELEAVEDLLFFEMNAGARTVGDRAGSSATVDAINLGFDGSQSYTFQVSPSLRPRTDNRFVRFESNNTVNLVDYTGGSDGSNNNSSNETVLNASLLSGPYFTTYNWDVGVTQTKTRFDDRDDDRTDYSAGIGYGVTPQLNLSARFGYEDNDVETSRDDTNGITWDVGANWNPTPRTTVSGNVGSRYFGDTYSGQITHRSRRTTMSLDVSRDIENRRNSRLVDNFFFLVNEDGDLLVDPITGELIRINIPGLEETDEDFLTTRIRGALSVSGRRTTVSITAEADTRDYEVSDVDEDSYGVSVSLSRQLGGDISASLNGSFDRNSRSGSFDGSTDSDDEDTDFYVLGLSVSKDISSRTSVSLDISRRERDSDSGDDDFTENRIGITLSTRFLD